MKRLVKLCAALALGAFFVSHARLARSHVFAPQAHTGMAVFGEPSFALPTPFPQFFNGRFVPPVGAPSCTAWDGRDARGQLRHVDGFDCFESVAYLTGGDPEACGYRRWPQECLAHPDAPDALHAFDSHLHPGDAVEFIAHTRSPGGLDSTTAFHAQFCIASGGIMFGANNTPAFHVLNGIPRIVRQWDVCTPDAYYQALRSVDAAWNALGHHQTYSLIAYHRPA